MRQGNGIWKLKFWPFFGIAVFLLPTLSPTLGRPHLKDTDIPAESMLGMGHGPLMHLPLPPQTSIRPSVWHPHPEYDVPSNSESEISHALGQY